LTSTPTDTATPVPQSTVVSGSGTIQDQGFLSLGTLPNVGSVQVIRNTSQNDYSGTFSLYQDSTTVVATYSGLDPYFFGMNFVAPHAYSIKYVSSHPSTTYYFLEIRIAPPTP